MQKITDDIVIMASIPMKHLSVLKTVITRAHAENTEFGADKIQLVIKQINYIS